MTRPPRILRIITRMNIGGPATHVTVADAGLQARGWETHLLYGMVEPDEAEIDVASLSTPSQRLTTLGRAIRPAADLRSAWAIARIIRRYRPDVIHTHLSKAGLLGRAAALATSRAVRVHTFHGTVFGGYFGARESGAIVRAERFLGRRTDVVVALSERQRQELQDFKIAPESKIRVVPLGLPLERFAPIRGNRARAEARASLAIPADAFVVLAMGRLVAIKRLDRLIDATAIAAGSVPNLRLHVVGGGSERESLERRAASAGLAGRISFDGWSSDSPAWYAAADVVALTSDREGTPLALIEAAASGRPVVATDVGGVSDVVIDGQTGFVVGADDIDAFAQRLVRLAQEPDLRAAMSLNAPAHAASFDAERLIADLDRVYREAIARKDRTA